MNYQRIPFKSPCWGKKRTNAALCLVFGLTIVFSGYVLSKTLLNLSDCNAIPYEYTELSCTCKLQVAGVSTQQPWIVTLLATNTFIIRQNVTVWYGDTSLQQQECHNFINRITAAPTICYKNNDTLVLSLTVSNKCSGKNRAYFMLRIIFTILTILISTSSIGVAFEEWNLHNTFEKTQFELQDQLPNSQL